MDLKADEPVDIYRKPATKEMTGWRGPGRVVAQNPESGTAPVQWQGRNLIVHYPHLRRHLYYSHYASSKCYPLMLAPDLLSNQQDAPFDHVQMYIRQRSTTQSSWSEHCG